MNLTRADRDERGTDIERLAMASEKYIEAMRAKKKYLGYYNELLGLRPAERQEAMRLSHNMRAISELKERLNRVCTEMDISKLGQGDVIVKSLETGQMLSADRGKIVINEAVEVIMPGGLSFSLQPIGEDVVMLKRELLKRQLVCDDILERTQAKDAYELRRLSEEYEELKIKMQVAKSEFEFLLKEISEHSANSDFEKRKGKYSRTSHMTKSVENHHSIDKRMDFDKGLNPCIADKPNFDSFVAIDINTTGISPERDSIIEIAAVKVVDGVIHETKEYAFDELVYPCKGTVSDIVQTLTGISEEKLKSARSIKEVLSDFMEFVGDNVLVGYNSISFDSVFLSEAGADCNVPIMNTSFDVLQYLRANRKVIGYDRNDMRLNTVSDYFGIGVNKTYRSIDDALSIAKIYMKLKELNNMGD